MNTNLVKAIKELGLKFGDFTLASGAKSKFYLDVKAVSLHYTGLKEIVKAIGAIAVNYKFEAIGGPTIGADPIVGAFLIFYENYKGFLVRSSEKSHGLSNRLVGTLKPGE